ncbi:MAG: hypothetical protein ACO1PW_03735 [Actinomycetota bacterium]
MCAGCMGTADFLLTGGVLGAASLRVAGRRLLPGGRARGSGKVTDAEAQAFVTRLRRADAEVTEVEDGTLVRAGAGRDDVPPA